ncbi:acyl-CoA carboxylase subunit beta [Conexibacter sp. DBS9H8]|uniref:acyl-CoA carboxylase subunit beta n=1 Tax=Conexibacter sp. DBS9H8 TaxID=2937801 RepID=UPI00200FAAA5|nr:carboxyl transferase domain-containing protein [Conexibacter sp. DBS9H8]
MRRIASRIDTSTDAYRRNRETNLALAADLREKIHTARYDRPARALARLAERNKLTVRRRLELLLDPGSPFLELSPLAAMHAYGGEAPQALIVTGIGVVSGREVMITAGDSSLKGGSWYPLSTKKIVRAQEIALANHLPVVNLVDSGGAYLPLGDEIYALGGYTYRAQCLMSGAGIPQLALVLGPSTAGGAYLPTLCDQSIMVRGTGFVFLGGPPLVKAATGEDVSADELGGADMHTSVSGTADYAVDDEEEGLELCREIVGTWTRPSKLAIDRRDPEPPYYDPDELYGIIPGDIKKQFDMREVIARIVDGSLFLEFKPAYGETMVTGWAYLQGMKVGILGNNGVLFSEAANKATQFMQLCDRDGTPLIFLHNITGFMVGREYERGGITKDGAKMLMVQANVTVPKFSVYVHASQGAGNYAMTGPAWDPRFLFAWPNSRSSIMGAEQAVKTLSEVRVANLRREQGREATEAELTQIHEDVWEYYERTSHPYHLTSELRDDGLIDPVETRNTLAMALSASLNAPIQRTPGGVLRI